MTKEELKPIDVSKYTITETGQVLKMTKEELKKKCTERVKIFQAMESCKSSSPMDCIEWFADRIAELEKENAQLKEANETLATMNNNMWVELEKKRAESQGITNKLHQLIKAKDHIKKLLDCLKQDTNDPQTNYYVCQYMDKAEQFLNKE